MKKAIIDWPQLQADLRETGLLATPGDRWFHPSATFYLEARPDFADRRQRSDRLTGKEAARIGLSRPVTKGRPKGCDDR